MRVLFFIIFIGVIFNTLAIRENTQAINALRNGVSFSTSWRSQVDSYMVNNVQIWSQQAKFNVRFAEALGTVLDKLAEEK